MEDEEFQPNSFYSIYNFLSAWRKVKRKHVYKSNEELVNILCRVYVEVRSHDGKYYSRNSMTAILAGLNRFLNKENTNYTMFIDRVFITDSCS